MVRQSSTEYGDLIRIASFIAEVENYVCDLRSASGQGCRSVHCAKGNLGILIDDLTCLSNVV